MTPRPVRARLQSLCGTNRRLRKEEEQASVSQNRRPCRYHAIWSCQGMGERSRRLPESR